jgi:AcrR family transcriptional regulator
LNRDSFTTKDKILNSTEELMARNGFHATSIRRITKHAGVNTGSIHYHFSSKEKLFLAVCDRKLSKINEQRLALLSDYEAQASGPSLEEILEAFLRPPITFDHDNAGSFTRLMAHIYVEPGDHWLPVFSMFEEVITRFREAFKSVLPDLSEEQHLWRFHLMIGMMCQVLLVPDQMNMLPGGRLNLIDTEEVLCQMIRLLAGGYRVSG